MFKPAWKSYWGYQWLNLNRMDLHSYNGNTLQDFFPRIQCYTTSTQKRAQASLVIEVPLTWKMLHLLASFYLDTSWNIASIQIIFPTVTSQSFCGISPTISLIQVLVWHNCCRRCDWTALARKWSKQYLKAAVLW